MSKRKEKILCLLDSAINENIGPLELWQLAKHVPTWVGRDDAEDNEKYRQVIPYIIVRTKWLDPSTGKYLYLRYKRSDKSGEARLATKISMGIGGHIEQNKDPSAGDPVVAGAERELLEEIKSDTRIEIDWTNPIAVIRQSGTKVDRVHIGLVLLALVDNSQHMAIYPNEDNLVDIQMLPLAQHEYEATENDSIYENWSKYVLESDVLEPETIPNVILDAVSHLIKRTPMKIEKRAEKKGTDQLSYILYKATMEVKPVVTVQYLVLIAETGMVSTYTQAEVLNTFGQEALDQVVV